MRLLFVSTSIVGGSGRSQRELATQLRTRGHEVMFVVPDRRDRRRDRLAIWSYGHVSDLSVRLEGTVGEDGAGRLRDTFGRRSAAGEIEGLPHRLAVLPQNAVPGAIEGFAPDVVVVSSVDRWAWRRIHAVCLAAGVPSVLYVREDDSLDHLSTGAIPSLLVANARSLAESLRHQGFACAFIPSVVDTSVTRTQSSREVALVINPVRSRGGDLVWQVAARMPDIRFAVQESWPLQGDELADVEAQAARLPNVDFRRRIPPGPSLYGDARVLLVPYRVDNRPRVILEAQANGIPVVIGDVPALVESVGDGGVCVPLESVDAWVEAIRNLWEDEERYAEIADAALIHGYRPDVDPGRVAQDFEELLATIVPDAGS